MTHQLFGGRGVQVRFITLLFLSVLMGLTLGSAHAATDSNAHFIKCEDFQDEDLGDVAGHKRLRTLTTQYWQAAEKRMSQAPEAFRRRGFVVGDFHFSNLGLYYDYRLGQTRLMLNDLDDAGTDYLLGDFLKFLASVKSLDENVKLEKVIDSYVKGLNHEPINDEIPAELRQRMQYTNHQNQRNLLRYIEKRKKEGDQFNPSSLTPEQKQTLSLIENLSFIKKSLHIDLSWVNNKDGGSSRGLDRFVFLATNNVSQTQGILEFKELRCSATGPHDRQDLKAIYDQDQNYLRRLFNEPMDSQSPLQSQHILFIGDSFFIYRIKLPNLINDLNIETSHTDRLEEFSKFYAHYLGYVHSISSDFAYRSAVASNPDYILKEMSFLKSAFKKRVKNASH